MLQNCPGIQRFAWLPWKRCGNLVGKMTASFRASLAAWSPATSSHRMFGFSTTTTPRKIEFRHPITRKDNDISLPHGEMIDQTNEPENELLQVERKCACQCVCACERVGERFYIMFCSHCLSDCLSQCITVSLIPVYHTLCMFPFPTFSKKGYLIT